MVLHCTTVPQPFYWWVSGLFWDLCYWKLLFCAFLHMSPETCEPSLFRVQNEEWKHLLSSIAFRGEQNIPNRAYKRPNCSTFSSRVIRRARSLLLCRRKGTVYSGQTVLPWWLMRLQSCLRLMGLSLLLLKNHSSALLSFLSGCYQEFFFYYMFSILVFVASVCRKCHLCL